MEYQYYAFISYKREDEHWAKWIQKKLESYKLPAVLQKQYNLEHRRVKPVFRDKTDLATGTVKGALGRELEASKYLIVICSPKSAKSEWVNLEAENFIRSGRAEYIIPFIISGTPFSTDPQTECFPPALRSLEEPLLGINIKEVGKKIAFCRLVAGLLGIRADDLIKREKRKTIHRALYISILVVITATIGGFCLWYYTPKTEYYADYIVVRNIPEGIFPLTKEEVRQRQSSYRFIYKVEDLREVDHINSDLQISCESMPEYYDRPPVMKISYDKYRCLKEIEFQNQYGIELMTEVYGARSENLHMIIDFRNRTSDNYLDTYLLYNGCTSLNGLFGLYLDRRSNFPYQKSAISKFEVQLDDNNQWKEIAFLNRNDMRVNDSEGICGIRYQYDGTGRVTNITYCDVWGNVVSQKSFRYKNTDMIAATWLNAKGEPVNNSEAYAYVEREFDKYGNCVSETFKDKDGNGAQTTMGYARIEGEYDSNGHCIKARFYDASGNPVLKSKGIAEASYTYDSKGNRISEMYFDVSGKPVENSDGVFGIKYTYDNNKLALQQYVDADNKPMSDKSGIAEIKSDYGHSYAFYDINGKPALTTQGYAKIEYIIGLPIPGSKITQPKYTMGYDTNGAVVNNKNGFAYLFRGYDDYDRLLTEAIYDKNDCLVNGPLGYKKVEYTYDLLDNLIGIQYMEDENTKGNGPQGFSQYVAEYNSKNYLTEIAYYDKDNHPISGPEGFAQLTFQYDGNGQETERCFYGADGQLCIGPAGFAESKTEYSEGKITIRYFGVDGELINNKLGYATAMITSTEGKTSRYYDKNGKTVEIGN